nr:hypothetical protein [Tanacetum cinerariifolium]
MDLFAFICHFDPTKVRVEERETVEMEVKLLMLTEGRTVSLDSPTSAVSGGRRCFKVAVEKTQKKQKRKAARDASGFTFPPKKLKENYHAVTSNIRGKSLATIRGLIPDGSSVSIRVTGPHVVVSMTPTLNDGPTDSVFGLNLRTCPPSLRYVVSSDDSHHSGSCSEVRFKSKNLEIFGDFASAGEDLDSKTLHRIYVPKWNVTNDFVLDDPYVCRDLTYCLAPPALFSQLHAIDYDQMYTKFNVGVARQAKAIEAIRLCGQLSVVEAVDAAKGNELRDLKERKFVLEGEKDALSEKVTALESAATLKETELVASIESERDMLVDQRSLLESVFELFKGRMEAMQDEQATILGNRVAELDAHLLEMAAHLDEEFYPRFLTAISGRVRGEIKKKCSSLMDGLVPLVEPLSSNSLIGEASTSVAPATTEPVATLSMTFASSYVVPPLSVSDYQVLDAEPHMNTLMPQLRMQTFHVRGRTFPLRSLSLYAPLPKASVISYGPSHLGLSLPSSSTWLASFFQ